MRPTILFSATVLLLGTQALADASGTASGYAAEDLMKPCRDADNDARDGGPAETECEQYLMGFVEALSVSGLSGSGTEICPPDVNTADEVRWALIRWIYGDFSKRKALPASQAVMGTLLETFPCTE